MATLIEFKDLSDLTDHEKEERVKAILLINGADDGRFDVYKEWLHKKAIHGEDCYPKTLCLAMTGWKRGLLALGTIVVLWQAN